MWGEKRGRLTRSSPLIGRREQDVHTPPPAVARCARFSLEMAPTQVSFYNSANNESSQRKCSRRSVMTTASVTLATSAGWQAGHAGVETDDAPPVMTADNWNVTDFYMIAAQLRTHTRGLQTNVRPENGSNRAEHEGGGRGGCRLEFCSGLHTPGLTYHFKPKCSWTTFHRHRLGFRCSRDKMEAFIRS